MKLKKKGMHIRRKQRGKLRCDPRVRTTRPGYQGASHPHIIASLK